MPGFAARPEPQWRVRRCRVLAPNIVRITIATDYGNATAPPGYGFIAGEDSHGWVHTEDAGGDDFRSSALRLHVDPQPLPGAPSPGERYFAPLCRRWRWRSATRAARPC